MNDFTRDPAVRVFTQELRNIKESIKAEGEYGTTSYTLPTSGSAVIVLLMGVLLDAEDIGADNTYMKGRVSDSSGTINVFAGQYQQEAAQFLQDSEKPALVAIVGKPKIYEPEDGSINISLTAESITKVTDVERSIWTQEAARATLYRLKEMEDEDKKSAYTSMVKKALASLDE